MTRRRLVAAFAALTALVTLARPAAAAPGPTLRDRVVEALSGARAPLVGAAVAMDGRGPVVDIAGWQALPPASTQKIYTAAEALLRFGPEHRLTTEVLRNGELLDDGTVTGNLGLVASGDPTITGDDLQRLAFAVANAGVRHVAGGLWIDDSRHDRVSRLSGWKPHYVPDESGPLSAFVVERNGWRRDADFLRDPSPANAERFRVALERAGVTIAGPTAIGPLPPRTAPVHVVAAHRSPPLGALVSRVLKQSDNLYAEQLLRELGAAIGIPSTNGGVEAVWRRAESFGLPRGQSADGSGLSAHDRAAPWHEVGWLLAMSTTPVGNHLRLSMPLACGDGTLQQRMCATPAAGRVFAKTGYLPGAVTLAGYGTTVTGRRFYFSFMVAGAPTPAAARAAIDRAVVAVVTSDG